jgi:hypothetical protein
MNCTGARHMAFRQPAMFDLQQSGFQRRHSLLRDRRITLSMHKSYDYDPSYWNTKWRFGVGPWPRFVGVGPSVWLSYSTRPVELRPWIAWARLGNQRARICTRNIMKTVYPMRSDFYQGENGGHLPSVRIGTKIFCRRGAHIHCGQCLERYFVSPAEKVTAMSHLASLDTRKFVTSQNNLQN